MHQIVFPAYRKYSNNKHFFKLYSETEFDEISFIGTKRLVTKHFAKILPDRNFISDLLHNTGTNIEIIDEHVYLSYLNQIV